MTAGWHLRDSWGNSERDRPQLRKRGHLQEGEKTGPNSH
jgi:hypothetical protein